MKQTSLLHRLLPIIAALALTIAAASCAPQKQYGCPNHLESSSSVD